MLELPIKKKWFDMIASGEKKEEYREIKQYWTSRFSKIFPYNIYQNSAKEVWYLGDGTMPQTIILRNGYSPFSPKLRCKCKLRIGQGKEEWGAELNKKYYILDILEVQEI